MCRNVLNIWEQHTSARCHLLCVLVFSYKAVASICSAGLCFALWFGELVTVGGTISWKDSPTTFWWAMSPLHLNFLVPETFLSHVVVRLWYHNGLEKPFVSCQSTYRNVRRHYYYTQDFSSLFFLKSYNQLCSIKSHFDSLEITSFSRFKTTSMKVIAFLKSICCKINISL